MHNFIENALEQTTLKCFYFIKTQSQNQAGGRMMLHHKPTTCVVNPSTAWENVHHGGDALASHTR